MKDKTVWISAVTACPVKSLDPDHYTDDGTCRCEEATTVSGLDDFWAHVHNQITDLRAAQTADDVMRICPAQPGLSGNADGFFGGSGGDESVEGALAEAGWTHIWRKAHYYWAMQAPGGDTVTYVEGDLFRGNQLPLADE